MCGISGYIARPGHQLPDSTIFKMTNLIYHRGPDDEGYLFLSNDKKISTAGGESTPPDVWNPCSEYYPSSDIRSKVRSYSLMAFGHRRLSILDLSPLGHQPMSYMNGRYWIIFNGEIYNFQEVRDELVGYGYNFSTRSDTETILAAYSRWGEDCLHRFVGMWAFVLYDKGKDEVFFARDRYGIKPLYYYFSQNGDFYFASEIKQFTATDQWMAKINPERVYDQLVYSFTDHTDESMFAGVFQLPSGCYYKSRLTSIEKDSSGRLKYNRWYKVRRDPFRGSFSEAAQTFRSYFERAVKEHLYADVPVGTALSGGLDSSAIVCEVNRILLSSGAGGLQNTFSSCADNEMYSEKKWMDIVVKHTKVNARFIFPQLSDVFKLTQDLIWYHDEPYQSQSAFLAYNVFRLASEKGVKVLLNGQGADEYLGGYGQFTAPRYATLLKNLKISCLVADIRNSRKINNGSLIDVLNMIISHIVPVAVKRRLGYLKNGSANIKNLIDNPRLGIEATHPYDSIPVKYRTVPEVSEHLTFYSTLPKYLRWEDRNSMANSVEARVPFLDHRLVEFAYNLPDDFLESNGITKLIMREALTGLLPEQIKNRKDKMGFATPEEQWIRKDAPSLFRKKIEEAVSVTGGIIKPEALEYFDKVVRGTIPFDYTYWRLILFSEWIKRFQVVIAS